MIKHLKTSYNANINNWIMLILAGLMAVAIGSYRGMWWGLGTFFCVCIGVILAGAQQSVLDEMREDAGWVRCSACNGVGEIKKDGVNPPVTNL